MNDAKDMLREHADQIIREAIAAVQPDAAVQRALSGHRPDVRYEMAEITEEADV